MTPKEFFSLVEKMREAQKEYFRSRLSSELSKSKRLEKEVDDEIKRVNEVIQQRISPQIEF